MSPWLFNLYMDEVVNEVQARTLGRAAQLVIVSEMNITMDDGLLLEEVIVFKYLLSLVTVIGGVEAFVRERVLEGG